MRLAFILDPLPGLKAYKDSSIAIMRAAQARGHSIHAIMRPDLMWREGQVLARAQAITVSDDNSAWYVPGETATEPLCAFDAVLMRQDPPFDFEYITATWLLERAVAAGVKVWNNPRSVRDHSEKIAITEFAQFTAPTLIARAADDLNAFIDDMGDAILKPLDGMGGTGIFRVRADDPNRNAIIETLTDMGGRTIMAQKYLPQIVDGDKRVLIIGGQVIPYSLARIPKAGETRGNLAAGGRGVAMPLTDREREIAETLAPTLWSRGLLIVGLDVIGGHLTEVNVTSPTCMVEIHDQQGYRVADKVVEALEGA
ncbi:glutathione synthase [Nitrogeniibacter aestuarii]|uniref:glutathione synthase n=1 Tax=Nitrogeniibacter aestuarii TaxID=2815343 RepID=UPI001D123B00|nr:glutathione synthase [Nitrogeniibacter aestuarii]